MVRLAQGTDHRIRETVPISICERLDFHDPVHQPGRADHENDEDQKTRLRPVRQDQPGDRQSKAREGESVNARRRTSLNEKRDLTVRKSLSWGGAFSERTPVWGYLNNTTKPERSQAAQARKAEPPCITIGVRNIGSDRPITRGPK